MSRQENLGNLFLVTVASQTFFSLIFPVCSLLFPERVCSVVFLSFFFTPLALKSTRATVIHVFIQPPQFSFPHVVKVIFHMN